MYVATVKYVRVYVCGVYKREGGWGRDVPAISRGRSEKGASALHVRGQFDVI